MKHIFIHIGKTAGTSFRRFLEMNVRRPYFGYGKLWNITDLNDVNKFLEKEPNGMSVFEHFDLFSEHFVYGLHPFLKTEDYQYITVLRNPVKRTISSYRYAKDRNWISEDTNIMDWFKEQKDTLVHYQLNHVSGIPNESSTDHKTDVAIKNLSNDKFIFGFTEEYNEFIDLCSKLNDWKPEYRKTNITKSKNDVTDFEKEQLADLLKDEIIFYDKAYEIYKNKYKNIIND